MTDERRDADPPTSGHRSRPLEASPESDLAPDFRPTFPWRRAMLFVLVGVGALAALVTAPQWMARVPLAVTVGGGVVVVAGLVWLRYQPLRAER